MTLKVLLLTIFLIFGLTTQFNLVPNLNNPIQLNPPTTSQTSTLSIKFSFASATQGGIGPSKYGSSGLAYKQYLGVAFPTTMSTELAFSGNLMYSCALSDGTNNYAVTAVQPVVSSVVSTISAESTIAYCRLDERNAAIVPLKTGPGTTYTLTLTFSMQFSSTFIRTVSLFTSTANHPEKVIIDSIPVIGNLALYGDYVNFTSKVIDINNSQVTVTQGPTTNPGNTIYPYNTFDLTLNLKVNEFVNSADYLLVFRYPSDTVSAPTSIITNAVSTDALQGALSGNLVTNPFGNTATTGSFYIGGISENLVPNRIFQIVLKGWKALDNNIGTAKPLEVMLYYKNTYSVVSYVSTNIFNVQSSSLTVTAAHPEGWDIWRNGAWPITFTIQSNNDLVNGGFIQIQHTNAVADGATTGNRFTFIASTCDFSNNGSFIDNSFSKRPACYPLRNDHNYPATITETQAGAASAIFFNLQSAMSQTTTYTVTVWVFADNCGGQMFDTNSATNNAFVQPQFTVTVYKSINANAVAEARFTGVPVIGTSSATTFSQKCWNNVINSKGVNLGFLATKALAGDNAYDEITVANATSLGVDLILYKEFTNWTIYSQTAKSACDGATCFGTGWGADTTRYIYSSTNSIQNSPYLVFGTAITMLASGDLPYTYFPLAITAGPARTEGKYSLQLPSAWFIAGDSATAGSGLCYLSVGYNSGADGTGNQVVNLLQTVDNTTAVAANSSFYTNKLNQFSSETNLPGSNVAGIKRIVTIVDNTNIVPFFNAELACTAGGGACTTTLNLGFLTTCVKWVASPPAIKSLYTAIDIQFQFFLKSASGIGKPSKNMRFIKLYPEGGVFNDITKYTTGLTATSVRNHFAFGANQAQNAVCLLEVSGTDLNTIGDANANTFLLWISFGSLLETDYSDVSATYPTGSLNSGVSAYGLSSQSPMHTDNMLINIIYNTAVSSNQLNQVYTNNARSNYQFLMGSLVYFNGVTNRSLTAASGTTQPPLYVPYYCPVLVASTVNNNSNRFVPVVMGTWATMSGYSSQTAINSYLNYLTGGITYGTYISDKNFLATAAGSASTHQQALLRFAPYTDTVNISALYIFNGYLNTAGTTTSCSGFVVMVHKDLTFASTQSFTVGLASGEMGLYNPTIPKTYYAFGRAFHRALTFGLGATGAAPTSNFTGVTPTSSTTTSTTLVTGINRPAIDSLVNSAGTLSVFDKVGFSCASVTNTDFNYLTSYFYITATNPVSNFVLDWNPLLDSTAAWSPAPTIAFDKSSDVFNNDSAGNIKFSVTAPSAVPVGTVLTFTALNNAFTANTICGLAHTGNLVVECTTSNTSISCVAPVGASTFNICCYNLSIGDTFSIGSFTVSLNANTDSNNGGSAGAASYLSSTIYSAASIIASNNFQWSTGNANLQVVKHASINKIGYSQQAQQNGAIGKINFELSLPRESTRNMKVTISGDFSALVLQNISPRCAVSFKDPDQYNSDPDSGDVLVDACSVANISNTTNSIIVNTKNIVYKCGQSFNKTLFISLWPVQVVQYSATNTLAVKVTMTLNDNTSIADNSLSQTIDTISSTNFNSQRPSVTQQWDSLCAVESIVPPFPGELADYTFGIDLDTNKASLSGTNPNELTIFWPYWHFGSFIPSVTCFSNGQVNCSFSDEGILNIRFSSALTIGSGAKIFVTVVGVRNPSIDQEISFACTVNNFSNTVRTVIMTGSGKLNGGITLNNVTALGNLRFLASPIPVNTPRNPRDVSTHNFRIAFDNAIGLTPTTINFTSTPVIHIYFPKEYNLAWYSSKALATIDEYTSDASNNVTITSTLNPASVAQSGNRVTITLSQSSYTFGTNWRYWDIKISQITNPIDSTNQAGPPTTQTTSPYYITLTNVGNTVLYRTYSNVNTYSADLISPASTVLPLQWNRGNAFNFDLTKWVVDVASGTFPLNTFTVKPGRYLQANFSIKANTNISLPPAVTTLSLTDSTFKTSMVSYNLSTSLMQPLNFYIGCPCSTIQGYYLINFALSASTNFAPLAPVFVTVDSSTRATISFSNPPNIPAAASVWVAVNLSEPNFDPLTVTWTAAPTANNDPTATLTNLTIPPGTMTPQTSVAGGPMSPVFLYFSVTSESTTLPPQLFITTNPNNCYSWATTTITFNINAQQAIIPVGLSIPSLFVYTNSDNDQTNVTAKNSIRYVFTPPVQPIYLFCALVCTNQAFPADSAMIFKDYEDMSKRIPANSPLVQHYYNFISSSSPYNILFNGLVRGQTYQMKCAIQSTQADLNARTTSVGSFSTYQPAGNSTSVQMHPSKSVPTQCASFNFLNEPGLATRQGFVNYCQRIFSAPGWLNNGCIVCTDSSMAYSIPGVEFSKNITCTATSSTRRLRFLQDNGSNNTNNTAPPSEVDKPVSFSVCPVPNQVCETDPSFGNKAYADYFASFIADLSTTTSIATKAGIQLVNINTTNPATTISDAIAPDTSKITVSITSSALSGAVSWTASTSQGSYKCYYQIAPAGTATPTFQALKACTDAAWCGSNSLSQSSTTFSTPSNNLKAFTAGTSYSVFYGCVNDIPNAQLPASVYVAGSFTTPSSKPAPPSIYCPDGYTLVQAGCSSSFITTSLLAIMILFAFLF